MTDLRKAAEMALEAMETLWDILDDIDTASDMAKENDAWYRKRVEALQKKRWDTTITTDGYKLKGGPVEALRQALAQPVQVLTAKVVVTGIEHESWCDSVTKLLLSMPPQIPPCNCKLKNEQGNSRPNYPISESSTSLDKIVEIAIQGHASTRDAIRWAMQQEREAIITWLVEDGFFVKDGTLSEQVREKLHHSIYFDVNRRKTPEVTPEVTGDVGACVTCGAPKGEWLVDAVNMSQERVDETAKREHEPWQSVQCTCGGTIYFKHTKREWVGLTDDEIIKCFDSVAFGQVEDDLIINKHVNIFRAIHFIEAKLKEKNT